MDWQTIMNQSQSIKETIKALRAVLDGVEHDFSAKEQLLVQTIGKDQQVTVQSLAKIYDELQTLVKTTQLPK